MSNPYAPDSAYIDLLMEIVLNTGPLVDTDHTGATMIKLVERKDGCRLWQLQMDGEHAPEEFWPQGAVVESPDPELFKRGIAKHISGYSFRSEVRRFLEHKIGALREKGASEDLERYKTLKARYEN